MRKTNLILFLIVLMSYQLSSQINWEAIDIPNDAEMKDIIKAANGNLFACFVGIYRSSDEGQTWEPVNKYEEDGQAYDFKGKSKVIIRLASTSNGYLYAINEDIYGNKLFRSKDNGENWFKLPIQISSTYPIYIDKNDRIYTQSDSNLVFSDDYGENWDILSDIGVNNSIYFITEDPDGCIWLGGRRSVLCKHKDSLHFESYSSGLEQFYAVTSLLFYDESIIGSTDEGLIISYDSAKSWKKFSSSMDGKSIYHLVSTEKGTIFCLTEADGFYRSDDTCKNWTLVAETFLHRWSNNLIIKGNDYYLASQGVYKSSDKGYNWEKINKGLFKSDYKFIHFDRKTNKYYLITSGGFYYSDDGLKSWTEVISQEMDPFFTTGMYIKDNGEILASWYGRRALYSSADGGETWKLILKSVQPFKFFRLSDGGLFMWGDTTESADGNVVYGLYYSSDQGSTWEKYGFFKNLPYYVHSGWNDWFYVYEHDKKSSNDIVRAFDNKKALCMEVTFTPPQEITFLRDVLYYNNLFFIMDYTTGFWKSEDIGDSFVQKNEGITKLENGFQAWHLNMIKEHFFLSTPTGLYISTDFGESWSETGPQPIGSATSDLYLLDDGRLYYSNSNGNFRTDPIYLSVKEDVVQSDKSIQVSPNPSDGEFTLKFELAAEVNCNVYIYGMDGKKLYEEDFPYIRSGENELQIMNTGLNSGCYILELRFGLYTKKQLIHIYK